MNPVQLKKAAKNLHSKKNRLLFQEVTQRTYRLSMDVLTRLFPLGLMEYFPDPEKVVRELARVANPNGKIIVGGPESAWFSKFALNRIFYTPSVDEVERIFRDSGLLDVKSVLMGVNTFFGTSRYVVVAVGTKPT